MNEGLCQGTRLNCFRLKVAEKVLSPVFYSPFSLKPLILWSPKIAASKLTTISFFIVKLSYAAVNGATERINSEV